MQVQPDPFPATLRWRLLEGGVRLLEWVFFPQLLMLANRVLKPRIVRPLSEREIGLAREIFHDSIDYQKVRMDERSRIACRKYCLAYVGFNFINSWGRLSDAHFIHEMVHVWQYQHLGAVYIPRALFAQTTPLGYDYGGIEALRQAMRAGRGFLSFNYEQQGDIVADYFRLKKGLAPNWCEANPAYLPVFEYFMKEVRRPHTGYRTAPSSAMA